MLTISNVHQGDIIEWHKAPHLVLEARHLKKARGGALLQVKLKNLVTNATIKDVFKPSDRFEEAEIEKTPSTFIYSHRDKFVFQLNRQRLELDRMLIGEKASFLTEGLVVKLLRYNENWIGIELPIKVDIKVKQTPPGVKGDTSGRATKEAVLENNSIIRVPLFIKNNDIIKINTRTGEYVERVRSS